MAPSWGLCALTRVRRCSVNLRRLLADRRGAAAVEFALTGTIFLGLVLFVIALGFRLYVEVALEYASGRAARILAVDSTQSRSASAESFQAVTFCPLLSAFLDCGNVTVALQSVTDYRTGSQIGQSGPPPFSPGQGGNLILLTASYKLPALSWPSPAGGGTDAFPSATVTVGYPYQNEY